MKKETLSNDFLYTNENLPIKNKNSTNNRSDKSKKNQIETNDLTLNIINENSPINYGNYTILKFDKNGDPLFVLGPDICHFIFMLIFNFVYFFFLSGLLLSLQNFYLRFIGILLNIIQVSLYILCSILNPGLPKKKFQNEKLLKRYPGKYRKCFSCNLITEKYKSCIHCEICGCCCVGYDHHCPWTTKCVGSGNIIYFHGMLVMVFVVFIYVVFAFIFSESKATKKIKKL